MNQPIRIPPLLIRKTLTEQIAEHNARVERIWLTKGSNCRPYQPSPTTVPLAADLSRVVAAEHSGFLKEVRS
ncbi:hypothetical protein AA309_19980 [Microvirga vignae]|uniref:Uncharacterized protein n=1 Tax=Microvirga vignae TaxID=1225564 RepID=A0A0H1R893_9HYPH|nr:hypothetical protein [Microvirga vignae]KLK91383.1 hypothetical protein AA309_19980 [Microvirga vignae]